MFEWTQDLAVGIEEIDNQHKELIKRMDNLLEAISQGKGRQELHSILKFMEDYCRIHFVMEERLMLTYYYPKYQAHKAVHAKFIDELNNLKNEFETIGAVLSLVMRVQSKTIDWLTDHIAKVDKQWGSYLKDKKKDGEYYQGNGVIFPIKDRKVDIGSFCAVQDDVAEKKRAEKRGQYLASYDEMTGLFNRQRFMELVSEWISRKDFAGRGEGAGLASLFLINMDEFRSINYTYGYAIGDVFLTKVTEILQDILKDMESSPMERAAKEGIIARLGGDEFVIFLPHLDAKEGVEVAERIRMRIGEPRLIIAAVIRLTVSIGIVVYPEHGDTVEKLFTRADAAMYRAKEMGRNRCHLYKPEDKDLEHIHSRLIAKEKIQNAIRDDCFLPWFQPIFDLKKGEILHYEALARMQDENGAILLPGAFIDTAERFGLVGAIDRVIIEKTMRLHSRMAQKGTYLHFSVNISGKDLGDEEFLSFLKSKINDTCEDPDHLIFEITETAAVYDLARAVKFISVLKSMGCHFSLDDFGVGFTSFIYLKEMHVDYVKIDGSFIKELHKNPYDQLFVKAIVDVAKGMGIMTIAEFVENKEVIKLLKVYGVDYAQGYAIGKPAPWEEIEKRLRG
jgi:diguanylate cyclase (GGDEF)-like protein/hemerythrin-like metal-binding protein